MTSTIKVNTVTTESGSTLTLGGCGKTVALASGASQQVLVEQELSIGKQDQLRQAHLQQQMERDIL